MIAAIVLSSAIRWSARRRFVACILVTSLALAGAGTALASTSHDLVGTWSCCGSGGAGGQTWKVTSTNLHTGTFKGSGGGGGYTFPISGKVSGRSVSLTTGPYTQLPSYSATFIGKVARNGLKMSGTWTSNAGQSGTWSAKLTTPLKKPKAKHKGKHKGKAKHKAKHKRKRADTIRVQGPTANLFHRYFNETVSGYASGPANYVISGEQLNPSGGCAATYRSEASRSDWYQWPTGTGAVHGKFSMVAEFWARNHHEHGICTYLLNATTRKTYAHASRFWNNS